MNAVMSPRKPETRRAHAVAPTSRRTFVLNLEHGLHARPCAVLVKTLQPYCSIVEVEANGEKASGKSILGLMALGAGHGSSITFTIEGVDAFQAMAELDRLFSTNFESAYSASTASH
jgi:phosphotransferase system HPr (HPr) family protein